MKISQLVILMMLTIIDTNTFALAHDSEANDSEANDSKAQVTTDNHQEIVLATGYALTVGLGGSSLDVDDEGESERALSLLFRIDKNNASSSYALQYSRLSGSFPGSDFFDDLFDCFFTSDEDCDEDPGNTRTLSDLSFLYGWRKPDATYSLGLGYIDSDNTDKKGDDYTTIGLVANLRKELFWIVDGIVHLNLNKEDSFATVSFGFRFD